MASFALVPGTSAAVVRDGVADATVDADTHERDPFRIHATAWFWKSSEGTSQHHSSCAGQADAMAKPAVAKAAASKKKQPQKEPFAQPALRWQLGGLIAGVAVAILSSTQPGKEV